MANLYLFKNYNNYYNRRIKRFSFSYMTANYDYGALTNINFNPNDELNTELIVNWSNSWTPDYMIEVDTDNDEILSRWFVIDSVRTRKSQYKLTLKRDILADNYNGLTTGIFSIDRCNLSPTNPLIFNKEGFNYNQVKKAEYKITDRTNCPWIVGYMKSNTSASHSIAFASDYDIDMRDTAFSDWSYNSKIGTTQYGPVSFVEGKLGISYENNWWVGGYTGCWIWNGPSVNRTESAEGNNIGTNNEMVRYSESAYNTVKSSNRISWWNWNTVNSLENQEHPGTLTETEITDLWGYNGKKVLFSDGVYMISFSNPHSLITTYTDNDNTTTQYIVNTLASHSPTGTVKHTHLEVYKTTKRAYVLSAYRYASVDQYGWKLPTTANPLTDAPYKMFCMPYPFKEHKVYVDASLQDRDVNMQIAMDILGQTTQDQIMDIQILPYCPVDFKAYVYGVGGYNNTYLTSNPNLTQDVDFSYITKTYTDSSSETPVVVNVGKIYFPKSSSFKFSNDTVLNSLTYQRTALHNISYLNDSGDKKINAEQQFIRLCDSTYTSVFEMSPAMNNGIHNFTFYCTYKPYNPYILVAPDFDNLYGGNYSDSRGLVCLGDYSLPNTDEAWQTYELNNKTYQQSFNRQITHMEREYEIQRQEQLFKSISGGITGTTAGAGTGAMVGSKAGPYGMAVGAIAGGVAGGVLGTAGGVLDYNNLLKRQSEEINYSKDMFNFNLQNIKAMPSTLTKTSAIVANTKFVPFIECYEATDTEKEVLADYLEYNGMTAGYVGAINPDGFVKASIIKYNEPLAAQEVDAMNTELMKGVYFE